MIDLSATELAEFAGVSRQAVNKRAFKGLLTRNRAGRFDVGDPLNAAYLREHDADLSVILAAPESGAAPTNGASVRAGRKAPSRPIDIGDAPIDQLDEAALRRRKTLAMCRKLELDTDIRRGVFVRREAVSSTLNRLHAIYGQLVMSVPARIAAEIVAIVQAAGDNVTLAERNVEKLVEDENRNALNAGTRELMEWGSQHKTPDEDPAEGENEGEDFDDDDDE